MDFRIYLLLTHLVLFWNKVRSMPTLDDTNTTITPEDNNITTTNSNTIINEPLDDYIKPDYDEEYYNKPPKPPKTRTFGFIIRPFFIKPFFSKFQIQLGGSAQFQHYEEPYYYSPYFKASDLIDIPKNIASKVLKTGAHFIKKISDSRFNILN